MLQFLKFTSRLRQTLGFILRFSVELSQKNLRFALCHLKKQWSSCDCILFSLWRKDFRSVFAPGGYSARFLALSESGNGGWKTRERGKHTINLLKNSFGTPAPHLWPVATPHLSTPVNFPQRERAQTRSIPLPEASKAGFRGCTL